MKPTHQLKIGTRQDAICWQYRRDVPVPAWIFRNFHKLGIEDVLTHRSGEKVQIGQWIVTGGKSLLILEDADFQRLFRPLPEAFAANLA